MKNLRVKPPTSILSIFPGAFRAIRFHHAVITASCAFALWQVSAARAVTLQEVYSFSAGPAQPYVGGLVQGSDGNFYGTTVAGGAYGGPTGFGTVFRMTSSGQMTTLASFNGTNGSAPQGTLVQGSDGNFYGTTTAGGSSGMGTVFRLTSGGQITTLVTFYGTNGNYPFSGLIQGKDGNFYGTTFYGDMGNPANLGDGMVFQMTPGGTLTILTNFSNYEYPAGPLMQGADGYIYGTTTQGGVNGAGAIFKMKTNGLFAWEFSLNLLTSSLSTGAFPYSGVVQGSDGSLYGTTLVGGTGDNGTIFKITTNAIPVLTRLYSFPGGATGAAGAQSGLVFGHDNYLYGTTLQGGSQTNGIVFRATTSVGTPTTLVTLHGTNGDQPFGTLVQGTDGKLYGTTQYGGSAYVGLGTGDGTVFQIPTNTVGVLTTLVSFPGSIGANPESGLSPGPNGSFYGTTAGGGSSSGGTVFQFANGLATTLVSFDDTNGPPLGSDPEAGLVLAGDGNYYGTTSTGGSNGLGTVFKLTPAGAFTSLVSFGDTNGVAGAIPMAGLVLGSDGNLYGTTSAGGSGEFGTVFRITTNGLLTTLVSFGGSPDGAYPSNGLVLGSDGNLYGTTFSGGTNDDGTIFEIAIGGVYTNLYSFNGPPDGPDGAYPVGTLIQGNDGGFYGATYAGGTSNLGTLFGFTTNGGLTTLASFNGANGANPQAGLVQAANGNFYGTTYSGGVSDLGTVFQLSGGVLTTLASFTGGNGQNPQGALIQGSGGSFYGTTALGGPGGNGVVFQLIPEQLLGMQLGGGALTINYSGIPGQSYTLKASTNLRSPTSTWQTITVQTAPQPDGVFQFFDPSAGSYPARYYLISH